MKARSEERDVPCQLRGIPQCIAATGLPIAMGGSFASIQGRQCKNFVTFRSDHADRLISLTEEILSALHRTTCFECPRIRQGASK